MLSLPLCHSVWLLFFQFTVCNNLIGSFRRSARRSDKKIHASSEPSQTSKMGLLQKYLPAVSRYLFSQNAPFSQTLTLHMVLNTPLSYIRWWFYFSRNVYHRSFTLMTEDLGKLRSYMEVKWGFEKTLIKLFTGQCFISMSPENIRKPLVFWRFQGV